MALRKCKECGSDVSSKAVRCPNCGAPLKTKISILQSIIIILVCLAIIGYFVKPNSEATYTLSNTPTDTPVSKVAVIDKQNAVTVGIDPTIACNLLSGIGLSTNGLRKDESEYLCNSKYIQFGEGSPIKNNIAYYVLGKNNKVKHMRIVLNVNSINEYEDAHLELARTAFTLYKNATGLNLDEKIMATIHAGINGNWVKGDHKILLVKKKWSNGKGYELVFFIQ
ncbi:MAG: hypothetical protein N0C86_06380 [Candidatus Thiodiazotropha taylori]|nr:hypothetical protein [Candidatus Thiodiazotropha taylori]MCW4325608.1 hypothetical protein [Candidatus Thiodiazotropha taylori]